MKQLIGSQSKKRLRAIFVIFLLLIGAVIGKLFHAQIIKHEWLKEKAQANWDREIPFGGIRGDIVDRHHEKIVGNQLAPTLYFMPSQHPNPKEAAAQIATVLNVDKEKLSKKMSEKEYMVKLAPEAKNITKAQADAITALKIPGLYTGVDFMRSYPNGQMLARLLGFTGYDGQGLAGIEYEYNDFLSGSGDKIRMYTDARGVPLPHVDDDFKDGEEGSSVVLTIDAGMQRIVERELSQAMEKYDATQALALIMNPKTGEILSLASTPSFDPSNYQEANPNIYNRNLPVWMTFEPGSTFKIMTLAAGLEEKLIDLDDETFNDPGYTIVGGSRLRCWKREGHGHQTFLEVVENSCNPGFVEIGRRLGEEKLSSYIRNFGFGESTGSGIAGEAKGILFAKDSFGPVEQATTAFGQGISVTPIQQVQAVAAAVNGGILYKPYIVKEILGPDGKAKVSYVPEMKRRVISEKTSEEVRRALESVVAKGSGRNAYVDKIRVGGKTGTAQKVQDGVYKEGDYIVSFIGIAPANDPELVVYVAIDSPKNSVQFGGVISAPIVGRIIEEIAPLAHIKPQKGQLEKEVRWGDPITQRTPDLRGLTKDEIAEQQLTIRIEWHGKGKKVKKQLPLPDTEIYEDDLIHLYTE